jgi:hypothetical protein
MLRALLAALAVLAPCLPAAARAAESEPSTAAANTLTLFGDVRAVAVDGERGWTEGGFGKLRYGGDGSSASDSLRIEPEFGEAGLVWEPRLSWSLGGTIVALAQGGDDIEAGVSEAFFTYKPLAGGPLRMSARAGLMWPPISLEHSGPEWAVTDTITPSAINSWVGEEVKVIGLEITGKARFGPHEISATIASFDFNDTAGTLLSFRGWALHDRKALAFRKQPLPPLGQPIRHVQPPYTHPILDLDPGTFKRPGYYAKLAWSPPLSIRLEALRYDNNANPVANNADLEWGWRTRFDTLALLAEIESDWLLRAQAMSGRTSMGKKMDGVRWVDTKFRAAYGMLTRSFDHGSVSARLDLFDTHNRGSRIHGDDDEDGWAATVALKRQLGAVVTALLEYAHVESERDARSRAALEPAQIQDQLQMALRMRW